MLLVMICFKVIICMDFANVHDVFQMFNLFLWLYMNILLLIGKLGPTL
jgi:hypothetical protein